MRVWRSGSLSTLSFAVAIAMGGRAASLPPCDSGNGGLTLPDGFCALVATDNLGPARHLVAAPNGDLYVAIQQNRSDTSGVYALRDTDGDGKFDQKERFGNAGGTGIALRNEFLYFATPTSVLRWRLTSGQLK